MRLCSVGNCTYKAEAPGGGQGRRFNLYFNCCIPLLDSPFKALFSPSHFPSETLSGNPVLPRTEMPKTANMLCDPNKI